MKSTEKISLWLAISGAFFSITTARADLLIDFAFDRADTVHSRALTAFDVGTTKTIYVFGKVNVAQAEGNYNGISFTIFRAQSSQGPSGALLAGGINASGFRATVGAFDNYPNLIPIPGSVADINGDGLLDLGKASGPSNLAADLPPSDVWVRSIPTPGNSSELGYYTTEGTWISDAFSTSTLLGTISVDIGAINIGTAGTTTFHPVMTSSVTSSVWWENAIATDGSVTGAKSGTGTAGIGVSFFTIPEPTTLGLLALGALGVLAKRRVSQNK